MTPLDAGDVVTVDHRDGVFVVNGVMVGGREVSVSRLRDQDTRRMAGHQDWRYVPVGSCHRTGDRMCAVHREPFPCGGCAYLAGLKETA